MSDTPYRVCVVCTGNICRSPMGDVILNAMAREAGLSEQVEVDSSGTHHWHIGDPADPRAVTALQEAGYDGAEHRARQFDVSWFDTRDLILAADEGHFRHLRRLAPSAEAQQKIRMLRSFDPEAVAAGTIDTEDPYYGSLADFTQCLHEVKAACRGVLTYVQEQLQARV